jgi:hypothetical protein
LKRAVAAAIACLAFAACVHDPGSALPEPEYRLVEDPAESAKPVALRILRHLAAGEIEQAAQLSNAPRQRHEVLSDFQARVGEEEFKRVYGEFLSPENRVIAEVALGPRRLLVWQLHTANDRVIGQYYVLVDGRFVMDDERTRARAELARVLARFRPATR